MHKLEEAMRPVRPAVFGVAGHVLSDHLVEQMELHGYTLRAWGTGWPCWTCHYDPVELPAFFNGLDYFVVTSEHSLTVGVDVAVATRTPIISPRRLARHRPAIHYEEGNWRSLYAVLQGLTVMDRQYEMKWIP